MNKEARTDIIGETDLAGCMAELADRLGDKPALTDGRTGRSISFAQLARQSGTVSDDLATAGVSRNGVIALVCDRSETTAALFLSLACHSAVAPVPAAATRDEVSRLLADLKPAALVQAAGNTAASEAADALGIPVLEVVPGQVSGFRLAARPGVAPNTRIGARVLPAKGLVLATSGTTGRPKLVPHTQSQLLAGARQVARSLRLSADDIGVEVMPLHHVHGLVAGLMAPFLEGAEVVISPSAEPQAVLRCLAESRARWYSAAPTIHQAIVRQGRQEPGLAARCRLRVVRSASSALPESVRSGLTEVFGAPVVEAYGMTEAGHQISAQVPEAAKEHGSLGVPPAGTVKIVGPDGAQVPDGEAGEVLVRGPTLTFGYLDDPEANARAFRDGWLLTGDIGIIDESGALRLSGRKKEIINRGGAQVAPAEIEDALLSLPGVAEAVAFGVKHPTLGQDVAAAVVFEEGHHTTPSTVRTALFDWLSGFKVPSRILALPELPKGPTGKLKRLDMETLLAAELNSAPETPETALESILTALFAETLGSADLGRDSDFFMAGGDSLSGVRLIVQINDLFGLDVSADMVFRHPTPAELAAYLTSIDGGKISSLLAELDDTVSMPAAASGGQTAEVGESKP